METINLDRFDLKLLTCIQRDNQLTADTLAEQVGLSPSATARRLRRLRKEGVVRADTAVLAEDAVGLPLSAVVQIQLERHAPSEVDALRRQLKACENVQLCLEISGSFDIVILLVAASMESFNVLMDRLLADNRAVRRFETSFVRRRVKASLAVPLSQVQASGGGGRS